jgi:recombination protein RecA
MTTSAMEAFGAAMAKSQDIEPEEMFLDTGFPPLNKILGGGYDKGFLYGRVAEIYGPAASGKTVLATLAMIQAQRAGGMALFVDWERAFSVRFAEEIGLDATFPMFHKITPETFEDGIDKAFEFVEQIRKQKPIADTAPIVMVFDSIAAAVPRSVMYDKDGVFRAASSRNMNDNLALAKATSSHFPKVAQMASRFNAVVIFLNQQREKPGVSYGDPTYTPGGKAPEYFSTTRLQVSSKKIMEEAPGGKEFKGRLIEFKTTKSKSTRPFQTTEMRLTYDDEGRAKFDYTLGLIDTLVATGKLAKDGKMIVFDAKKYYAAVLAKKIDTEDRYSELVKLLYAE